MKYRNRLRGGMSVRRPAGWEKPVPPRRWIWKQVPLRRWIWKQVPLRRWTAWALAWALALLPALPAFAEETVYFLAADENILPLSESTMPFWEGGYLYISSAIFTSSVAKGIARDTLGVTLSQNQDQDIVTLTGGTGSLIFAMGENFCRDGGGELHYPGGIWRQGRVFVPAALVAECFGLAYSVTAVEHGNLVWLRHQDFPLSVAVFVNAASFQLNAVYEEYAQTPAAPPPEPSPQTPPPVQTPEPPAPPSPPVQTAEPPKAPPEPEISQTPPGEDAPQTPEEPDEPATVSGGGTLYLCFRADSQTEALLDTLDQAGVKGAFFCGADFLENQGGLLRRMAATGHSIGLLAENGDVRELETCNRLLERSACLKTRLVRVADAAAGEAAGAGYLPVRPDVERDSLRTSDQRSALLGEAGRRREAVIVWLDGAVSSAGLSALLEDAAAAGSRPLPLRETAVGLADAAETRQTTGGNAG